MLLDVESCYIDFEFIALALRVATKKLLSYFQAHTMNVLFIYSIRAILHKTDAACKLLKWAIELSEFDIVHRSRTTIKSQVLLVFIAEFTDILGDYPLSQLWILKTDESSKRVGGNTNLVLQSLEG